MGIESIIRITGTQNYQSQVATAVSASESTDNSKTDDPSKDAMVATSGTVAPMQPADQKLSGNKDAEKGEEPTGSSSLKGAKDVVKVLNKNTVAEFGYNEPTHMYTIKIKDKDTGKVLREIPSDDTLKMFAKALELAGIAIDEKR